MPAALSNDLKERIVKWYNVDGLTMKDISSTAECSIGLVSNVLRNHQHYGQVSNPYSRRTGRPSYLSAEDLNYLQTIITTNPSIFLDELQHKLTAVHDVHVSVATISRALIALNLSRKLITKAVVE
jgi:transposase